MCALQFVALLLLFGVLSGAFAQATLRVGDPVELTISGVPQDEQTQVNNIYTVDANGSINLPYINKVNARGTDPGAAGRRRSSRRIGPTRFTPTRPSRS